MAASEKKPSKGILKTSSSFDHDGQQDPKKQAKWDEMNILATYHPPDKDYGHMKIDEPLTPYNRQGEGGESGGEDLEEGLDAESLAARLETQEEPRVMRDEDSSSEDENETEEERGKRKKFENLRKLHYNEFYAVKLARQLMDEDDAEDEGNDESSSQPKEESDIAQ